MEKTSLKSFLKLIGQFEEKCHSIELIQEDLFQILTILCQTHENLFKELQLMRNLLKENAMDSFEDDEEIIEIDGTKSEWDEDEDEEKETKFNREISPLTNRTENSSIKSASSYDSTSTIEKTIENQRNSLKHLRVSNLKKSEDFSSRMKSPKSVTFILDEEMDHQSSKKNESFDGLRRSNIPLSLSINVENEFVPLKMSSLTDELTNIRIHEIDEKRGEFLRLLNVSNSDDYDLTDHFLQQNLSSKILCRFRFPLNTIIRAGQTITIWCGNEMNIEPHPPHLFLWKEQRKWQTESTCLTFLAKPNGQIIASFRNSPSVRNDSSSSDILFLHSKSTIGMNQLSTPVNSLRKSSRVSSSKCIENHKPAFSHSPSNPIHPDYHPSISNLPTYFRSPIISETNHSNASQLLKRAKSSPFVSHRDSQQDRFIRHFFHQRHSSTIHS